MHICAGRLVLHLPDSQSLKARRQVARSLTSRIRNRFNVSVAEDPNGDRWQSLTLVVCATSNDASQADALVAQVADFVTELRPDLELVDFQVEVISGI